MARRVSKEVKEEILSKVKAGEGVVDLASQYGVGINRKNIYCQRRQPLKDLVLKQPIFAAHTFSDTCLQ